MNDDELLAAVQRACDTADPVPPEVLADARAAYNRRTRITPPVRLQALTEEDAQGWVSGERCGAVSGGRPQPGSGALSSDPQVRGAGGCAAVAAGTHPTSTRSAAIPVAALRATTSGGDGEDVAVSSPDHQQPGPDRAMASAARASGGGGRWKFGRRFRWISRWFGWLLGAGALLLLAVVLSTAALAVIAVTALHLT